MNAMYEVVELQGEYQTLVDKKQLTKKAVCALVIPFRDKHHLTDKQALMIARNEMPLSEMIILLDAGGAER